MFGGMCCGIAAQPSSILAYVAAVGVAIVTIAEAYQVSSSYKAALAAKRAADGANNANSCYGI
jgi:hypothetical protein